MDNHVHLLVKCKEKHISLCISRVHSLYAKIFNKKYRYIGYLFQNRYFTKIIEDDSQFLETCRYIHLNSIRAKMVKKPEEYEWSSYSMTIGLNEEKIVNSRKITGYAMSKSIDTVLALQAVRNAIKLQKPTKTLIIHSDLGCQYTSSAFKDYIESTKLIKHSFSGKGCLYDNACIEYFQASLKKEEVHFVKYFDYDAAGLAIFE